MKTTLKAAFIAAATLLSAGAAQATTYWVQDGVHLNARSGPSAQYHKVGTFNPCTKVHVIAYQHGWAKVAFNHKAYWVSAKYLQNRSCHYQPPAKTYHAPAKKKTYNSYKSY